MQKIEINQYLLPKYFVTRSGRKIIPVNMSLSRLFVTIAKLAELFNEHNRETGPGKYFSGAITIATNIHIIRQRRQKADGRVFVVQSFFDRLATKTAEDKLRSLVAMEAEKEVREII